jgi:hypothetical protein
MSCFQLVEASQAGADALGILIPPGRRTLVVVRPRPLPWDLLLARYIPMSDPQNPFREMNREEAEHLAHALHEALESWSDGSQPGRVEPLPAVDGGNQVRAVVGKYSLLVCERRPGQAYRPHTFPTPDEAREAADIIAAFLRPQSGVRRELYLNTRNFSR